MSSQFSVGDRVLIIKFWSGCTAIVDMVYFTGSVGITIESTPVGWMGYCVRETGSFHPDDLVPIPKHATTEQVAALLSICR